MIVPRAYSGPSSKSQATDLNEKRGSSSTRLRSTSPRARSALALSQSPPSSRSSLNFDNRSDPVKIPSRTAKLVPQSTQRPAPTALQPDSPTTQSTIRYRRESTRELLSATAIPIRRKPRGRPSQRLPKCDYVADFSKLLLDDIKPTNNGLLTRSLSSSHLDGLFGHMDELVEGQMIVGSEGIDSNILSGRSVSSESLNSLVTPDDFGPSNLASAGSSVTKSPPERRFRQFANSEDCGADHPLNLADDADDSDFGTPPELYLSTPKKGRSPGPGEKKPRSFRSSLTASLRAIRSAAQSVSVISSTPTEEQSNDLVARSFFDIQPSLTDDRRPPPSSKLPSPELRRYLNPTPPDSPAQLHFWQDHRHSLPQKPPEPERKARVRKSKSKLRSATGQLPPIVPLSTCLPPSVRTAHASSPPIWLAPDGTPSNKNTSQPLLYDPNINDGNVPRNREPRENRDFLRVFVCEMEMRRRGKLNEDVGMGRARLWLPPVSHDAKKDENKPGDAAGVDGTVQKSKRWDSWSVDDL